MAARGATQRHFSDGERTEFYGHFICDDEAGAVFSGYVRSRRSPIVDGGCFNPPLWGPARGPFFPA